MVEDDRNETAIAALEARLRRYPADRYPVQHATARFHLGLALTDSGRLEAAETALDHAVRLFDPDQLRLEHAKATLALGVARRLAGRLREAAEAFERAAAAFEACDARAERGAARFNLGLVRRDLGETAAATECFELARGLFEECRATAHVAAATRELGATALAAGELERAERALRRAVELAAAGGDEAGRGAAANALGLTRLAAGRADAIEALRDALAAHPRTVRPDGYAMVQANLALAYEKTGEAPRARLAARQALAIGTAAQPVRDQAAAVLRRLGGGPGEVLHVLDEEPAERWAAVVREEVARWGDLPPAERRAEAGAWIDGQLARPDMGAALAEAWVGALLELPPAGLEQVIAATVEALGEREPSTRSNFRDEYSMAAARFHVPQLLRLADAFNRIAVQLGEEPEWR